MTLGSEKHSEKGKDLSENGKVLSEVNKPGRKQKDRPKAVSLHILIGAEDQAARSAVLLRRRYAMKPTPAKPMIIMAQVDGSGTAADMEMSSTIGEASVFEPWKSVSISELSVAVNV